MNKKSKIILLALLIIGISTKFLIDIDLDVLYAVLLSLSIFILAYNISLEEKLDQINETLKRIEDK